MGLRCAGVVLHSKRSKFYKRTNDSPMAITKTGRVAFCGAFAGLMLALSGDSL